MAKHIHKPQVKTRGKRVGVSNEQLAAPLNFDHPIFCFKYLHGECNLTRCDKEEKAAFADRLVLLTQLTWDQITLGARHGSGSEQIDRPSILQSIPLGVTADVDHFLSVRFQGLKPFVGFRNRFIFHIVFIDNKLDVYNHGS